MNDNTIEILIGDESMALPIVELPNGRRIAKVNLLDHRERCLRLSEMLATRVEGIIEAIVVPEVKAIPLGVNLGNILNVPCFVARKSISIEQGNITSPHVVPFTSSGQPFYFAISMEAAAQIKGRNVLIVDDVVTTGSTVEALASMVNSAGGNVKQTAVVFREGDAVEPGKYTYLAELPIPDQNEPQNTFDHFALQVKETFPFVYTAISKHYFCYRVLITKYAIEKKCSPFNPFMSFDFAMHGLCSKGDVITANNSMLKASNEVWVFGPVSDGVLAEIIIARRLSIPVRYFEFDKKWNVIELNKAEVEVEEPRLVIPFSEVD